jgi:hypothetical protein
MGDPFFNRTVDKIPGDPATSVFGKWTRSDQQMPIGPPSSSGDASSTARVKIVAGIPGAEGDRAEAAVLDSFFATLADQPLSWK